MCTDVLILAGGAGERLWPVSSASKPKQFLRISGGSSFLQNAVKLAWALNVAGKIYIITRTSWIDLVLADIHELAERERLPDLPAKIVVMGEPFGKNTAPAVAWISRTLETMYPDRRSSLLLMASDHVITNTDNFIRDAETASRFAELNNLVSFSIPPRFPSTGYGYINAGAQLEPASDRGPAVNKTVSFHEKPDEATASQYLKDGSYYWNSGLYAFRCSFYLEELEKHAPEIAAAFTGLSVPAFHTVESVTVMNEHPDILKAYTATPSVSIDYAVSEKCERAVCVLARFEWDDVGSWDSLSRYMEPESDQASLVDCSGTYVVSDIPVVLCGVEDCIVVIRDGKALVCRKDRSSLIREALTGLKKKDVL